MGLGWSGRVGRVVESSWLGRVGSGWRRGVRGVGQFGRVGWSGRRGDVAAPQDRGDSVLAPGYVIVAECIGPVGWVGSPTGGVAWLLGLLGLKGRDE